MDVGNRLRPDAPTSDDRLFCHVHGRGDRKTDLLLRRRPGVTNMAKAALNMLTRTSAADLAARGIHACSIDTGWVTDEKPLPARERHAATGWRPPLDVVDGAARICHPVVQGQSGTPLHGVLLKDCRHVPW